MIADLAINQERKQYYYEQGYWTTETLEDIWNTQVESFADREYVVDDQGERLTYKMVDERASRVANWLQKGGVSVGDVVSFQIPIWSEFAVIMVACLKVGAVMHPLSMRFNGEDLVFSLNLVESKAFICPKFFHGIDYEQQLVSIVSRISSVKCIGILEHDVATESNFQTYESLLQSEEPLTSTRSGALSDEVALILSTSGSTGKPKAVLLTHNNILFSERQFVKELNLTDEDVMFMPAPLNHATGFNHGLISPMILGGKTILEQSFCAEDAVALMNKEKVTWTMGATPFVYDILNYLEREGTRLETLRFYLCGGAPVPGSMVHRAHDNGIVLCEVYGSTESCPHIYVPPAYALGWNGKFSGRPFQGIEVRVVDEKGNDVEFGVQGEEVSRGPNVFVGYFKDSEGTKKALSADGWFYSGDLCTMDARGRVRINGRKKDIIIRGGVNLSTSEIDEAVLGCPGIADYASLGMADERLGERICLYAVAETDNPPTLDQIIDYLKEKNVAKRLWPEHLEYIDEIPRTESGKIKRTVLGKDLQARLGTENIES